MREGERGRVPTWPTISLPVIRRAELARGSFYKGRVHHNAMFIERPLRKVFLVLTMRASFNEEG